MADLQKCNWLDSSCIRVFTFHSDGKGWAGINSWVFIALLYCECNSLTIIFCFFSSSIDGVASEISLIHPDDINWFVTMDETHHEFSTEGHKGGSTAIQYSTSSFHRSGEQCITSTTHTTGVYGTSCGGEALPPLYILSLMAQDEENYWIDPTICKRLPIVVAKYAGNLAKQHPSFVVVGSKGSMDTSLWHIVTFTFPVLRTAFHLSQSVTLLMMTMRSFLVFLQLIWVRAAEFYFFSASSASKVLLATHCFPPLWVFTSKIWQWSDCQKRWC